MDNKTAKMKSELSQLLENLPASQTISSDVWQIREILGELGVLERPDNRKNWPKGLTWSELEGKIGQKVYFVDAKRPKHGYCDYISKVDQEKNEIELRVGYKLTNFEENYIAFDGETYAELCKIDPEHFSEWLCWTD